MIGELLAWCRVTPAEAQFLISALQFVFGAIAVFLAVHQYRMKRRDDRRIARDKLIESLYTQDTHLMQKLSAEPPDVIEILLADPNGDLYRKLITKQDEVNSSAKTSLLKAKLYYSMIGNLLESYLLLRESGFIDANIREAWDGYAKCWPSRSGAFKQYLEQSYACNDDSANNVVTSQTWTDDFYRLVLDESLVRRHFRNGL